MFGQSNFFSYLCAKKFLKHMRIKINFSNSKIVFNESLNKEVNGFINKLLGEGNKYHGNISRYSVSSMQGAVKVGDSYSFPNGAYLFIASDDGEFIGNIMQGLITNSNLHIRDMYYTSIEISDYDIGTKFDLVRTISPILINDGSKQITFKDDNFIELLTQKSIKKLIFFGMDERKAKSLKLSLFHPENAKTASIPIGKSINIGSKVMLYVEGHKEARKLMYELGFGKCTGFGFGAVSVNKK